MKAVKSSDRFTLIAPAIAEQRVIFARRVAEGLTASAKYLPCEYFYDRDGSLLFEEICELPEYYLSRAETGILQAGAEELVALVPPEVILVELGSGSGKKASILIDALLRRQNSLTYLPVDISPFVLESGCRTLLERFPALEVRAIAGDYDAGLCELGGLRDRSKLILWLGSNIGNLDRTEAAQFLRRVGQCMSTSDRLLVGIDLRKDADVLQRAYDDSRGVTARFNQNLLSRINRELGGHFNLESFQHHAVYAEEIGRIEMYLVSNRAQTVSIDGLKLEVFFKSGETIHTENSYKYSPAEIDALVHVVGFGLERQWFDDSRRFSVNLLTPQSGHSAAVVSF